MADGLHSKRLSLDTNVLLDLAANFEFAVGFRKTFQGRGYSLHCTPGVLAELSFLTRSEEERKKSLAATALDSLILWDISPIHLTDAQKTYRKNFVDLVEDRGILPKGETNDARILADTAIESIPMLVTSDGGILEADQAELAIAFADAGLPMVSAVSPKVLWRRYAKKERPKE